MENIALIDSFSEFKDDKSIDQANFNGDSGRSSEECIEKEVRGRR